MSRITKHRVLLFSCYAISDSFVTPWAVAHQYPLSMGFPRQYWSGLLPFPSPGDLPHSGIELASPALAGGFFTTKSPGKPEHTVELESKEVIEPGRSETSASHSPSKSRSRKEKSLSDL